MHGVGSRNFGESGVTILPDFTNNSCLFLSPLCPQGFGRRRGFEHWQDSGRWYPRRSVTGGLFRFLAAGCGLNKGSPEANFGGEPNLF